jgi:DNA-directed RNA polymerase sigma subunit (sigma70/sigma32)
MKNPKTVAIRRVRLQAEYTNVNLKALPEKDATMVARRLNGETLDAIGKTYGITRERVRQVLQRCLNRSKAA